MLDQDTLCIRTLDEKSSSHLLWIRVVAEIEAKGLQHVLTTSCKGGSSGKVERQHQESNVTVKALSDHALRFARAANGDPILMLEKLDNRYDSNSTVTKISKMSELVSMRFASHKEDTVEHVDCMVGLLEQLKSMGTGLGGYPKIAYWLPQSA